MSQRFLPAAALAAAYLDNSTPVGLFQTYRAGKPYTRFLVIQDGSARVAIALDPISREQFAAWSLKAGTTAYHGVALGAVELEVDIDQSISHMEGEAGLGDVTLMPNAFYLRVATKNVTSNQQICIGAAAGTTTGSPPHVFNRWRLVQRDRWGNALVLFERKLPAGAAAPAP